MIKIEKALLFVFIVVLIFTAGCVKRIVTIDSQPSVAEVFFGSRMVGTTPCSFDFTFYGCHPIKLVKEGYKDFYTTERLKPPVYEYLPFDFISENLLPFQFEDVHNFSYQLVPEDPIEE